jgi:hypothetical protein
MDCSKHCVLEIHPLTCITFVRNIFAFDVKEKYIYITMAQQPYMGSGLLLPRLLGRAHSWQLVTGQLAALLFYRSWCDRQNHLAGSQEILGLNFCLRNISIHARKVLLHAVNLRHGTDGFTSPPKEVVLLIFITLKNPSTSVGIEPANLGSTLTTSPPKSTSCIVVLRISKRNFFLKIWRWISTFYYWHFKGSENVSVCSKFNRRWDELNKL